MKPEPRSDVAAKLYPSKLGAWAAALMLLAGILGLLSFWFQSDQVYTVTFWLRLLSGMGFLLSGLMGLIARHRMIKRLEAAKDR